MFGELERGFLCKDIILPKVFFSMFRADRYFKRVGPLCYIWMSFKNSNSFGLFVSFV